MYHDSKFSLMKKTSEQHQKFLRDIRPKNDGSFEVEPFETYRQRVNKLLPNWPDDALENWLHRHFDFFVGEYSWLGFDKMLFTLETWNSDRIYTQINSHKLEMIDDWGKGIFSTAPSMQTWLQRYFIDKGTWPVPIIILNNSTGIVNVRKEKYGQPYHLLEGHLRLGYFRNIIRKSQDNLNESHNIWVVSVDGK